MDNRNDYFDYSHLDAPDVLQQVLSYYFTNAIKVKNYALPKRHFDEILRSHTYVDARRFFRIITGTDLVTKKIISSYKTDNGVRYLVRKEDYQQIQRMQRVQKRSNTSHVPKDPPQSQRKSPFMELADHTPLDDSSSDEESIPTIKIPTEVPTTTNPTSTTNDPPSPTADDEDSSTINTEVTKIADEVETNFTKAMTAITDQEDATIFDEDRITTIIQPVFKSEVSAIIQWLQDKEVSLVQETNKCKLLNEKLQSLIDSVVNLHQTLTQSTDKLTNKYNYLTRTVEEMKDTIQRSSEDHNAVTKEIRNELLQIKTSNTDQTEADLETLNSLLHVHKSHEKLTRRINRIKDGSKQMFHQQELDFELLTDRVQRLESNYNDFKKGKNTFKRLSFSSGSDSSEHNRRPFHTKSTQSSFKTPNRNQYTNTYYRGPNLDYLQKNVNMTCSEQNQILEFYIKFRLALEPGGIYIIPIDEIVKNKSIAQDRHGITVDDQRLQSNALFTLLSNEKIIPSDFTMAQNCILGFASTMDGFGAFRAMLKLTHPTLSKKRPSNVPPVLSESTDIHAYEQSLRNFYLLHKLFSDTEYEPIEKAKQFLRGMDDEQYNEAVQRIQHQLDTAESLNVPLNEDYDIENIASTIINISGEYDNTKAIVNTMRNQKYPQTPRNYFNQHQQHKSFANNRSSKYPRVKTEKFDPIQCFACKAFGHTVTHCRLLPRVLAILHFNSKHSDKCSTILKQHIRNNTVDSKRVFVRTLQNMEILSVDDDSDTYLEHDIIVNTLTDNGYDNTDFQSDNE